MGKQNGKTSKRSPRQTSLPVSALTASRRRYALAAAGMAMGFVGAGLLLAETHSSWPLLGILSGLFLATLMALVIPGAVLALTTFRELDRGGIVLLVDDAAGGGKSYELLEVTQRILSGVFVDRIHKEYDDGRIVIDGGGASYFLYWDSLVGALLSKRGRTERLFHSLRVRAEKQPYRAWHKGVGRRPPVIDDGLSQPQIDAMLADAAPPPKDEITAIFRPGEYVAFREQSLVRAGDATVLTKPIAGREDWEVEAVDRVVDLWEVSRVGDEIYKLWLVRRDGDWLARGDAHISLPIRRQDEIYLVPEPWSRPRTTDES